MPTDGQNNKEFFVYFTDVNVNSPLLKCFLFLNTMGLRLKLSENHQIKQIKP